MLGLRFVADGFDVVTVRADDEGCIVGFAVLRANPRGSIVLSACLKSGAMKLLYL